MAPIAARSRSTIHATRRLRHVALALVVLGSFACTTDGDSEATSEGPASGLTTTALATSETSDGSSIATSDDPGSATGTTNHSTGSTGDTGSTDAATTTGPSTGPSTTGETGTTGTTSGEADVPGDNPYCAAVVDWDDAWVAQELEVLERVNELRAHTLTCVENGAEFGPSEPFVMNPALRCAARVHVKDMADNNFFDHTGSDGSSYHERAQMAGYLGQVAEDLGSGYASPAAAVNGWLNSPAHCIYMLGNYKDAGVGRAAGSGGRWALEMGK